VSDLSTRIGEGGLLPALPTADGEIAARLEEHARHARGAYSANTERAIRSDTAVFTSWCLAECRQSLPASADTLVGFIDAMAASKAPATVRRYLSSIAVLHRAAGLDSPTEGLAVKLALKRMHREKGRSQRQAAGLIFPLVARMLDAAGERPIDLRNAALLSLAYDTLCRRSELVALEVRDVDMGGEDGGTVLVRRSKTDQEGAGQVRYMAPDTSRRVRAWLEAADIAEGPIFRSVRKGGRIADRLDASEVPAIFKRMARVAGVPLATISEISGHSTRVGAAQDLVGAGIALAQVMRDGGWKSPEMVARYTRRQAVKQGGMAKLAALQNRA
jgi:integrase